MGKGRGVCCGSMSQSRVVIPSTRTSPPWLLVALMSLSAVRMSGERRCLQQGDPTSDVRITKKQLPLTKCGWEVVSVGHGRMKKVEHEQKKGSVRRGRERRQRGVTY